MAAVTRSGSCRRRRLYELAEQAGGVGTITHGPCHERKASAIDSIESVKRNAPGAEIDDQTGKSTTVPLDACIGLAVPGRPIGPWSRTPPALRSSATRDRNPESAHGLLTRPSVTGRNSAGQPPVGERRIPS
jgi:Domain of unknown function (DUF1508)